MRKWLFTVLVGCVGCASPDVASVAADGAFEAPDGRVVETPPDAAASLPADAGGVDLDAAPPAGVWSRCFPGRDTTTLPAYDAVGITAADSCAGTNHQSIDGIEKVVFIGDSITEGTPPTLPWQYYRALVEDELEDRFGSVEVAECARWGARTDDLLLPPHQQVLDCFPGVEPKRTLVVMTIGGNDMHAAAKAAAEEGADLAAQLAMADEAVDLFRDAIEWFHADPARFPAGVFVIFANVYNFSDNTADLSACTGADWVGMDEWPDLRAVYTHVNQEMARVAADTGTDMVFLNEHFCGHGFLAGDATNECYRGAGSSIWFDFTCTHPTPEGHEAIADLVIQVVDE